MTGRHKTDRPRTTRIPARTAADAKGNAPTAFDPTAAGTDDRPDSQPDAPRGHPPSTCPSPHLGQVVAGPGVRLLNRTAKRP